MNKRPSRAREGFKPLDMRVLLAGDDPARIIRAAAADLLDRAMKNTEKREREALRFKYTTRPTLQVTVEQVQYEPPVWRMRTTEPLMAEVGCIQVEDTDPNMLESELRLKARNLLLQHGYADNGDGIEPMERARQMVTDMKIERVGRIIALRDSQRVAGEWNR